MDDLLVPAQTSRNRKENVQRIETSPSSDVKAENHNHRTGKSIRDIHDDLVPISREEKHAPEPLQEVSSTRRATNTKHPNQNPSAFVRQLYLREPGPPSLPDDAREILKGQPSKEDLGAVLQYLDHGIKGKHDFNVHANSPKAAQILHVLVIVTIPDQWASLEATPASKENTIMKRILLSCFRCVAGIGALLAQLKLLITAVRPKVSSIRSPVVLKDILSVLSITLSPSNTISHLLLQVRSLHEKQSQQHVLWTELVALLAGGRVLSAVAEVVALAESMDIETDSAAWLGDGSKYGRWLATNICQVATELTDSEEETGSMLSLMLRRALSLGHKEIIVSTIYKNLLFASEAEWVSLHLLIRYLPRLEKQKVFEIMLRDLSRTYLSPKASDSAHGATLVDNEESVSAVAAVISGVMKGTLFFQDHLVQWLSNNNGVAASCGLDARRAMVAALAVHEGKLHTLLDRCMQMFSDKLHIKHTSVLQQESTAQVILLTVGYLYRKSPDHVIGLSRSSQYLNSVSNRLASSLPRARFLGMIVGTAISRLADSPDKAINFGVEEMNSEEAEWWFQLTSIKDHIGSVNSLKTVSSVRSPDDVVLSTQPNIAKVHRPGAQEAPCGNSKVISIEELDDDESDDGLIPYQKPDEDLSDSDEDPTLINRNKPVTPVYIVDLIKGLRTQDKPDTVELALKTAPSLIRRKANFGTELSENVDALASTLINLQDGMSKEEFHRLRLESMIACAESHPARMGPWLASMYFEGDFSLSQRANLLTTIGLSCRELAGYKEDPLRMSEDSSSFPSKRLPQHFAALYAPVSKVAGQLTHSTLQPMALAAADKISGPNVLKIRTFSSRIEVEKKTAQKAKDRQMRIPKDLHKLLAESFFLPLCCRMSLLLSSRPDTKSTTLFEPHILRLFLQTLTILLATLGPHALQLAAVTRETLLLLTSLHLTSSLSLDPAVLPPLLQLLLMTLDINIDAGAVAEENLVSEFGTMIAELVAWASNLNDVFKIPTTTNDSGTDGIAWTVLAAAIQVKWHETGRKFQGRMIGLMAGQEWDGF